MQKEVDFYSETRSAIKKHSGEELDIKPFEADMRHLLNTYARLPRWFLRLHQLSGRLEIDVTQNDLAALLGVQRTTVSKAQDQLKREGLLAYARGRIQILDVAGLKLRACPCAVTEHV